MCGESVVIVGTGRVVPGVAAAFAAACDSVLVAGRDEDAAKACAATASALGGTAVLSGGINNEIFGQASLVVETVVERLDVKRALLARIDPWLRADAVVVSNTSSLPLDDLAACMHDPRRFAGLHFLHPAHLTKIVELVPAATTSDETVSVLHGIVLRMQKRPIMVSRPVPGYVWNRLQMAVLRECLALVESGVTDAESVDAAVAEGLAPRWLAAGPLATADAGGLATFYEIARQLFPLLAADTSPSPLFTRARDGDGFYEWTADDRTALEAARTAALDAGADVAAQRPRPRPRAEQTKTI